MTTTPSTDNEASEQQSQALVLVGHGSHLDPGAARPLFDHADTIRERGIFDAVRTAFWKGEPSLRSVRRTVSTDRTFIVPVTMSSGYFSDEVFPRELGITNDPAGPDPAVHYTEPVGTHPNLTDVILARAERATAGQDIGSEVGLAVVGHGTERNPHSGRAASAHAERIRDKGLYEEVRACFLDQEPAVAAITSLFSTDSIVVVPLFVAAGGHVTTDIPDAIGLATGRRASVRPEYVADRTIWYTPPVGTAASIVDVVLRRAEDAGATIERSTGRCGPNGREPIGEPERAFLDWIQETRTRRWGELDIAAGGDEQPRYWVRHQSDSQAHPDTLEHHRSPLSGRAIAREDDNGRYRPLRGAETLSSGWLAGPFDRPELVRFVEGIYPTGIADWWRDRQGTHQPTPFDEAAARQTGRYEELATVDDATLDSTRAAVCGDCVRRPLWDASSTDQPTGAQRRGQIPCPEPCPFFLDAVRACHRAVSNGTTVEASNAVKNIDADDSHVGNQTPGELDDPHNRYRRRFREALRNRPAGTTSARVEPQ